jgi:hypothetical protein
MATEAKTRPQDTGIDAFLDAVSPAQRQAEARQLHALFSAVTGFPARIWGSSMVGYGRYAYRYDSGHSGQSMATGFAPRKAELVVYILPGYADFAALLADLGPHRLGKSCLYLRRLDGIDTAVLGRLIRAGLDDLATRWTVEPV